MKQENRKPGQDTGTPLQSLEFVFENRPLTCVMRGGDPWFINADVCRALALTNPRKAVRVLDDDEKAEVTLSYTSSNGTVQRRRTTIISESGLYTLILRSRGATTPGTKAHRFRKWVAGEVLPSIRKNGGYHVSTGGGAEARVLWIVTELLKLIPAVELLKLFLPKSGYGEISKRNGLPKKGFRSACHVAQPHREALAAQMAGHLPVIQFVMELIDDGKGGPQA